MQFATRHFVRPASYNHHGTVYAGQLADWMTEAAMIGVTQFLGKNENVVLAAIREMRIIRPVLAGTILDFQYEVGDLGTTSIEIRVEAKDMSTDVEYLYGSTIFVTVGRDGKKVPHELTK